MSRLSTTIVEVSLLISLASESILFSFTCLTCIILLSSASSVKYCSIFSWSFQMSHFSTTTVSVTFLISSAAESMSISPTFLTCIILHINVIGDSSTNFGYIIPGAVPNFHCPFSETIGRR